MAKAKEDIRSLARSHTESAIKVLVGIMNQPKAPAASRVAAAQAILDRGWGKPKESIEVDAQRRYVARIPEPCETVEEWVRKYAPPTH